MQEKKNILRILRETKRAIIIDNAKKIKLLSDQTINTASMTQDGDNIAVAVIVYSLSKIFERQRYHDMPGWKKFSQIIISSLDNSIKDLENNDEKKFREDFELIRNAIGKLSGKLKKYIQDVFRGAQISKASRIYEHGISMEKTARLLGITMFELANYAGQTGISDVTLSQTYDAKSRIKMTIDMFK